MEFELATRLTCYGPPSLMAFSRGCLLRSSLSHVHDAQTRFEYAALATSKIRTVGARLLAHRSWRSENLPHDSLALRRLVHAVAKIDVVAEHPVVAIRE